MIPADLADERARRNRKAYRRLATDFRHARIHATPDEAKQLDQLVRLCRLQLVAPEDAHADIKALRVVQDVRLKEAAAARRAA